MRFCSAGSTICTFQTQNKQPSVSLSLSLSLSLMLVLWTEQFFDRPGCFENGFSGLKTHSRVPFHSRYFNEPKRKDMRDFAKELCMHLSRAQSPRQQGQWISALCAMLTENRNLFWFSQIKQFGEQAKRAPKDDTKLTQQFLLCELLIHRYRLTC
jgi:hypothetical protein